MSGFHSARGKENPLCLAIVACLTVFCAYSQLAQAREVGLRDGSLLAQTVAPLGPVDGVYVASRPGSAIARRGANIVDLQSGALMVSVRPPASMATVVTPLGNVSVGANADAVVMVRGGIIKVQALRGAEGSVTAMLEKRLFPQIADPVVAVAPGRDLIATGLAVSPVNLPEHSALPPASAAPAPPGAERPRPAVAAPQPGTFQLLEVTAASLGATASLVRAIDQANTNSQERRFFRDLVNHSLLSPWPDNVNVNQLIAGEKKGKDEPKVLPADPPKSDADWDKLVGDLCDEGKSGAAPGAGGAAGESAGERGFFDYLLGEGDSGKNGGQKPGAGHDDDLGLGELVGGGKGEKGGDDLGLGELVGGGKGDMGLGDLTGGD